MTAGQPGTSRVAKAEQAAAEVRGSVQQALTELARLAAWAPGMDPADNARAAELLEELGSELRWAAARCRGIGSGGGTL